MTSRNATMAGETLLIVEDDILPAICLKEGLEEAGFNVLDLTEHVETAIAAALAAKPALALVNIELHGRDDGIGLARELKLLGVPVLFISGQVSRAHSSQTVAIASLPKPFAPDDAVQAVRYLLARRRGDRSQPCPPLLEVFDAEPDGSGAVAA